MKNIVQGSLITTFRCNAKCNMCNIWKHQTHPDEEIDCEYYKKLPAGLRINITGGEATLRKDIDKIFEILYPKSSLLELSTNGYNTEKIVELANKSKHTHSRECGRLTAHQRLKTRNRERFRPRTAHNARTEKNKMQKHWFLGGNFTRQL